MGRTIEKQLQDAGFRMLGSHKKIDGEPYLNNKKTNAAKTAGHTRAECPDTKQSYYGCTRARKREGEFSSTNRPQRPKTPRSFAESPVKIT